MPRTITTSLTSFSRPQSVSYVMPPPGSNTITIRIPPASTWTSGLHWHSTHTEFLEIVQGSALVTLGSQSFTRHAGDVVRIEKHTVHEWKRAEAGGEELVVQEWTDPADGMKEVFFRNLNSVILDGPRSAPWWWKWQVGWWIELQILAICREADNWPVFWDGWGRWCTYVVLRIIGIIALVVGAKGWYEEYTPVQMRRKTNIVMS